MSQQNAYQEELKAELEKINPDDFSHAARLISDELKRVESGDKYKYVSKVELHHDKPSGHAIKVRIPVKEFPKFNFVGKLLGPKGNTLKRLQEESGCKMSILGKGSVRDKQKEEEMRKEGGKYAHLNEELHVLIEAFAETTDAYARFSHCLTETKKFLVPDHNDDVSMQQMQEMMYLNGDKPGGRGRGRGGPAALPGRGGLLSTPGARGGLPARGAPRGARGSPAGRGRAAPMAPVPSPMEASYDDYSGGYGDTGYDSGYGKTDPYDAGYGGGHDDTQYFDYGHGSAGGYEDYGASAGYGGSSSFKSPPTSRGRGQFRSHPYGSSGRGGY
ncbi:hypothetical protein CHS0354_006291 [Potamilus streckersoni]|uniref:K Homology domain-containing protein n=1 Tax=Potamilus streckersoni TaxID=2493646 RepID=A0AAE0S4P6_9BIVA|nr:hypothetical protein CHS0354_006291 [Potamilus streckersoni]